MNIIPPKSPSFEPGRFYRQHSTNAVYRCEMALDVRTLLHTSSVKEQKHLPKRILLRGENSKEDWSEIPEKDESRYVETYNSDAIAEYGAEVGLQGIVFRRQYHFNPYLDVIGDQELKDRMEFITDNLIRYDVNGAPHLLTADEGGGYWQQKLEEIVECLRINERKGFFRQPGDRPNVQILTLSHDIRKKTGYEANEPWNKIPSLSPQTKNAMFKFGEKKYLRQMLEKGEFRICPASYYDNPSLNAAQHDSHEQRLILRLSKNGFPISFVDEAGQEVMNSTAHQHGQLALEIGGERDYFVWCCSKSYEPRLFVDFEADACLVIHDHQEFAHRLNDALYAKINYLPGMVSNDVRYYDWLCQDEFLHEMLGAKLPIHFFKDFRYAYQSEYRFTWPIPEGRTAETQHVELGSLKDICDLIELNDSMP